MKRKFVTKTYLRDVSKYQVKLYLDEEEFYLCAKKFIKVDEKFIIQDGLCVMDDGYYSIEVVPKNENYAMRLFFNDKKERLEYYFDICKNNGLDNDTLVPFYDDLYLDITLLEGKINILDENEFIEAYRDGDITKEDYELVLEVRDKILKEIKEGTNKYINMDYTKYLFD